MKNYEWKEMEEIFRMLEEDGMNPRWCDTPVKFYDNGVKAGIPDDTGMETPGEVMMLAREKTMHIVFCWPFQNFLEHQRFLMEDILKTEFQ